MFCPQCGQQIQHGSQFCASCGNATETQGNVKASARPVLPRKYVYLSVGLLAVAVIGYQWHVRNAERRAEAELQHTIDSLGFKPGDEYCYAPDAEKNWNGYWPTSYVIFEELMESLRAHDPVAPNDLTRNSVHVIAGYQIWILETNWQLGYTKGRISRVPPNDPYSFSRGSPGFCDYTIPLPKFWVPCR